MITKIMNKTRNICDILTFYGFYGILYLAKNTRPAMHGGFLILKTND